MPDVKKLVKEILDDLDKVYYLFGRRDDQSFEQENEARNIVRQLSKRIEFLSTISEDVHWDNKANRRFQTINAILLVVPTILGLAILFWGSGKIAHTAEIANTAKQEFKQKDSIIDVQNKYIFRLTALIDSLPGGTKMIGNDWKLPSAEVSNKRKVGRKDVYITYELSGYADSLDLRNVEVDLLLLKNPTDKHFSVSIVQPSKVAIEQVLFVSADPGNSLSGPNGQIGYGQTIIISVAKLREIGNDVTFSVNMHSLRKMPPYQTLKLKFKKTT